MYTTFSGKVQVCLHHNGKMYTRGTTGDSGVPFLGFNLIALTTKRYIKNRNSVWISMCTYGVIITFPT